MPEDPDPRRIDWIEPGQERHCRLGVLEHLAHQRVAAQQPIAHLVVVLLPIVRMWVCPGASPPAIFKADRIWRENDESPFGKCWTERLQRISDEPTDLALPEVALAVMLMVHKDGRRGFAKPLRHQQECRNRVTVGSFVGYATS